jgi:hypothetical protein
LTSCEEPEPEMPQEPCIIVPEGPVEVNTPVVFRVCSQAGTFTIWPGDEGHDYEKYGIDKGINFEADSFEYTYSQPGNYTINIVGINTGNRDKKYAVSSYSIQVTENNADFYSFSYDEVFPPIEGQIIGDSIFLTVPFKTDISNLKINFDAGFASVYVDDSLQVSDVSGNDFSSPVTYRIVSWNKEFTKEYTVVVDKIPPRSDNELISFTFQEIRDSTIIYHDSLKILSIVPFGTKVNNLVAEFSVSEGATVKVDGKNQESGKTANNYLQEVNYEIVAEDGSSRTYDIEIEEGQNDNNNFLYFAFTEPSAVGVIDNENRTITVEVPEGTDLSTLSPIISTSKNSTVYIGGEEQISGESVVDFSNPVYYIVKAENGDIALYTVTVKQAP